MAHFFIFRFYKASYQKYNINTIFYTNITLFAESWYKHGSLYVPLEGMKQYYDQVQ